MWPRSCGGPCPLQTATDCARCSGESSPSATDQLSAPAGPPPESSRCDSCTLFLYKREVTLVAIQTTYTEARARLAELCDRAIDDRETVIISRRGSADVALIAADELSSLLETAHLL